MCARACVGVPKIQQSLVLSSVPPSCHIHYLNRIYKCQAHDMDAFCREVGDWISWVCCLCYSSQRLFFFRIPYRDYSKHHHLFGIVGRHSTSSSACVSVCVCVCACGFSVTASGDFPISEKSWTLDVLHLLVLFFVVVFKIFNRSLWGRPRLSKCWPGSTNQTKCPVQLCERLF